jgi:hypothetical protein
MGDTLGKKVQREINHIKSRWRQGNRLQVIVIILIYTFFYAAIPIHSGYSILTINDLRLKLTEKNHIIAGKRDRGTKS